MGTSFLKRDNPSVALDQWQRYVYMRDAGHIDFIAKADLCDNFFIGNHWSNEDKAKLKAEGRPALTINKVLPTLANILGEEIQTRSEITYRAKDGTRPEMAELQTKVFRSISEANRFQWVRDNVFADGAITSRGFFDIRMEFDTNAAGNVQITHLNPKNVIVDPDADSYEPDNWADCITTKWLSPDDIELLYNKEVAERLRSLQPTMDYLGTDSLSLTFNRDRFGRGTIVVPWGDTNRSVVRQLRVLERQHRVLNKVKVFVDPSTGESRRIPEAWDRNRIAHVVEQSGVIVLDRLMKRVRWTVTCADEVLFDEWSPYGRLTVIPYFPFFRYGRTIGLVENLIDPQQLLNKVSSQELHVVNTTANSGWKVKQGALANMTPEELEEYGSKSGLVIEVNGNPDTDIQKITPNAYPSGLDRISYKAEEHIKTVSGRGDAQQGLARADVSGKAIGESKAASDASMAWAMANLERTDHLVARMVLDLVQEFYTDPRVMQITKNALTEEQEEVRVNEWQSDTDELLNDLTVGTFDISAISQPAKRSLEESQFEQAVQLRELGVPVPAEFLIENSNLLKRGEILRSMKEQAQTPEAKLQAKAQLLQQQLEVANLKAEASRLEADASLKRAKAEKETAATMSSVKASMGANPEMEKMRAQLEIEREKMAMQMEHEKQKMELERQRHEQEMALKAQMHEEEIRAKRVQVVEDARMKRAQAHLAMRQQAQQQNATSNKEPVANA